MAQLLLDPLSCFRIYERDLLHARVVIHSNNDHCPAPFSRALVGLAPPSLLGARSRHYYGINVFALPLLIMRFDRLVIVASVLYSWKRSVESIKLLRQFKFVPTDS